MKSISYLDHITSDWFLRWFSEQVSKSRLRANVAPPYSQNSYKSQMCLNDQWQTIQKQRLQVTHLDCFNGVACVQHEYEYS